MGSDCLDSLVPEVLYALILHFKLTGITDFVQLSILLAESNLLRAAVATEGLGTAPAVGSPLSLDNTNFLEVSITQLTSLGVLPLTLVDNKHLW